MTSIFRALVHGWQCVALSAVLCISGCGAPDASGTDASGADGYAHDAGGADAAARDGDQPDAARQPVDGDTAAAEVLPCADTSELVRALQKRAADLDGRERELEERQHTLKLLDQAVEERLIHLEKTRDQAAAEVARLVDERAGKCLDQETEYLKQVASLRQEYEALERGLAGWEKAQQQRIDAALETDVQLLTKALNTMRPEKAAATLGALDSEQAAMLLGRLPERSSGKILAAMQPDVAAGIVKAMLAPDVPPRRADLLEVGNHAPAPAQPAGGSPP
jgi:flagellar motility protein MotE (MotC chaperone)